MGWAFAEQGGRGAWTPRFFLDSPLRGYRAFLQKYQSVHS